MPETVDPRGAGPYGMPLDSSPDYGSRGRTNALRRRRRAARHSKLTRALAEGVDPSANDELALRGRQLTSARNRKMLARSLCRTIADAHLPASTRVRVSIIDRRGLSSSTVTALLERRS